MTPGEGSPRIAVAGGGTTGHLSPGLAVAGVLRERGCEILFMGTARGPEARLAPNAGYRFAPIPVIGRGRGVLNIRNAKAGMILVQGWMRSIYLLRRFRPDAVLGTGGYVSLPVTIAARVKKIPVVIHEQNVVLGLANRIAARFAVSVCLSFPETSKDLAGNFVVTGNPVRHEIATLDRSSARDEAAEYFELDAGKLTVLLFGGSQGAAKINSSALGMYTQLRARHDIQLLHLTGSNNLAEVRSLLEMNADPADGLVWRAIGYTDRMDLAYAIADLAVCRAGASTIAELSAVGLPTILVPLPRSLDDDQRKNAEWVVRANAGAMIPDGELDPVRLIRSIEELLKDPARREQMSERVRELSRPNAARDVAELVLGAAGIS